MSLDISLEQPACVHCGSPERTVEDMNMTHNVAQMWRHVGVYDALYMSDGMRAGDTLPALSEGVEHMRFAIDECRAMNPSNGWGYADRALAWLERWTAAVAEYPCATIRVSK